LIINNITECILIFFFAKLIFIGIWNKIFDVLNWLINSMSMNANSEDDMNLIKTKSRLVFDIKQIKNIACK
jgi:hypothetical protein